MSLIFSITIAVEIIVLLSILYVGKIPDKIKQESYESFELNVLDSVNSIEDAIESKLHFEPIVDNITTEIINHFGSKGNVLTSSKTTQLNFISKIPEYLVSLMIATNSNGAYLILENNNEAIDNQLKKEGIYIAIDYNSIERLVQYNAIILSGEVDIDIDYINISREKEEFSFNLNDENDQFYSTIKNATLNDISEPYINYRFQEFLGEDVINITYPIVEDRNLVALIGVEISVSTLFKVFENNQKISYLLGYTENNDFQVKPIFTWNDSDRFITNGYIKLKTLPSIDKFYLLENDNTIASYVIRLSLYDGNNNPYNNQKWVFIGFISIDNLVGNANYVENVILLIIIISFAFGALMIYLITTKVTNPIKVLSEQVRNGSSDVTHYKKSNIEEINNLIISFEKLTQDVTNYSNKLTNAINTFLLGIYYYHNNEEEVYCTQPFLEMCGSKLQEGYIKKEEFDKLYNKLVNSYFDEKYHAYQLANGRWVKIDHKIESTFTLGIVSDITDNVITLRKMEEKLDIDGLTQIYNRHAFNKIVAKLIEKNPDKVIAIVMWDIDKLKYINDRYGHEIGDRYIIAFSDIIKTLENDGGIVARRSGDEFLGAIVGKSKKEISFLLSKIRHKINQSELEISSNISEKIRASFGIAWYPDNGKDLNSLLEYADKKLYQFKFEFGGLSNIINSDIDSSVNIYHFNKELSKIIDGDYITFAYQPIVDVKTGNIFGYEMLMRIFSDILNNPKKLIEIATENAKLNRVEELTFSRGFESYQLHKNNIKDRKIFINSIANEKISSKAFEEILEATNYCLDMLVVELVDLLSANPAIVKEKVDFLKSINSQVAIDNFKAENFSEAIISFPVDFIKVDISIIRDIDSSIENQNLLNKIVAFAKENNYKVIAVGINKYEELVAVINAGVDYVQGYYIGEPTVKPANIKDDISQVIRNLVNKD